MRTNPLISLFSDTTPEVQNAVLVNTMDRVEVQALIQAQIGPLQAQNANLQQQVGLLQQQVAQIGPLQQQVAQLENDMGAILNLTARKLEHILFIGTSTCSLINHNICFRLWCLWTWRPSAG